MKKLIIKLFAILGIKISRLSKNQGNTNVVKKVSFNNSFEMQKHLIKEPENKLTIFDLGAYDGETALKYKSLFPKSKVYSFEPFPNSYSKLVNNTSASEDIIAINKGIADKEGIRKFNSNSFAPTNSLLDSDEMGSSVWGTGLMDTVEAIDIEITTIDSFVETYNIKEIDILKMDVQGAEYMVLEGAKKSIEKGLINIIYTEIMTLPSYKNQLTFDEMISLMRTNGFTLFHLYNFSLTDAGQLRNVDAIFFRNGLTKTNHKLYKNN